MTSAISTRTRTVSWSDPAQVLGAAATRSGLEWMQAIRSGEAPPPPSAELLGIVIEDVGLGRAIFSMGQGEFLYNPMATVHGGLITTLADFALTSAIITHLKAGELALTLDLKMTFIRPATVANGRLRATGSAIHVGGSVRVSECMVTDSAGLLIATGTATCQIRRPK